MLNDENTTPPPVGALSPIGRVFGGSYRIVRCLAVGGMARVFEAEHVRLKRPFAVKVIAEHMIGNPQAKVRFQNEAETISQLNHPNVVQVTDYDTTPEGEPYLVMELLEGESLATRLEREHQIPTDQLVLVVWQVASALAYAHEKGIIHRDLTPANIFLTSLPGQPLFVKLLDFGISKAVVGARQITRQFEIVGTVQYMAPEQAIGGLIDTSVDQFALASIVYRALSGVLPFPAGSPTEVLKAVAFSQPIPIRTHRSDLPLAVEGVLARAMAKAPAARYERISDFAVALARAVDSTVTATFSSAPPPLVTLGSSRPPGSESPEKMAERLTLRAPRLEPVMIREVPLDEPAVLDEVAGAEQALERGEKDAAWEHCGTAERALRGANGTLESADAGQRLERIYEALLGGGTHTLRVPRATAAGELTPEQAFLLSRVGESATVNDIVDLSQSSRRSTLRNLVALSRSGHLQLT